MTQQTALRVTADPVVVTRYGFELCILLARREKEPFADKWQLPTMPVAPFALDIDATLRARLSLQIQTESLYLEQVEAVSGGWRDPRAYAISHTYLGVVRASDCTLNAVPNSPKLEWFPMPRIATLTMAFDHANLIQRAMRRFISKAAYSLLPALVLEEEFTLPDLERLYASILGTPSPNATLRRRLADDTRLIKTSGSRKLHTRDTALYRLAPGAESQYFPCNLNYMVAERDRHPTSS